MKYDAGWSTASVERDYVSARKKTDSPPPVNKILRVLPLAPQSLNPIPGPSFPSPPRYESERTLLTSRRWKALFFSCSLKLGLHFSRLGAPNGISVYARSLLDASSRSFHLCSRIWPPTRADLLKILPPCSRGHIRYRCQ